MTANFESTLLKEIYKLNSTIRLTGGAVFAFYFVIEISFRTSFHAFASL